jgi:Family of unknown function (DUF6174)
MMPMPKRHLLVLAALAVAAPIRTLAAQPQQPAESWCVPPVGGARVWGTALDSVTQEPLPLLVLQLQPTDDSGVPKQTGWWARTDSLGRFCFRGTFIQQGRYRLTATHPPVLGHQRPPPAQRDLRVALAADTAVSLPYRSFRALDSIATDRVRDSLLAVIGDQRRRWRARRPARYYYEAYPNCLCPIGTVTVVVAGDSVIGTLDPKTGAERLDQSARSLMTIDGIFDWLERDVRNPENNLWYITWNDRFGFPARWEAGRDVIVIDAYGGATITRFEPALR